MAKTENKYERNSENTLEPLHCVKMGDPGVDGFEVFFGNWCSTVDQWLRYSAADAKVTSSIPAVAVTFW